MIQEAYCSYKVARLLKEKGFDELCNKKYNGNKNIVSAGKMIELWQNSEFDNDEECSAPTHQMALAWLRENYNLYVCPKLVCFRGAKKGDKNYYKWEDRVLRLRTNNQVHPQVMIHEYYNTYEEAVEAALKYVLETQLKSQCTEDDEKEEDK